MVVLQLTWIALVSIRTRLGSSLVTVLGTAALTILLLFFNALTTGLSRTLLSTGRDDRAIILRSGAESEATSRLPRSALASVSSAVGVRHSADGTPTVSPELITDVRLGTGSQRTGDLTVRGVTAVGWALRPEIVVATGRMPRPGAFELIVGRTAQLAASGHLPLGGSIDIGNTRWKVVGVFRSAHDVHESEAFADLDTILSAYHSNLVSSFAVALQSPQAFDSFRADLASRPDLSVQVHRESDYYRQLAEKSSGLISLVSSFVCVLMALGSIFAAAHTVFSAVSARAAELATLRAFGFSDSALLGSIVLETLILGTAGSLGGGALLWLTFANRPIVFQSNDWSRIVFDFSVDARTILIATGLTVLVCLIGALAPALRVLRTTVAVALRRA